MRLIKKTDNINGSNRSDNIRDFNIWKIIDSIGKNWLHTFNNIKLKLLYLFHVCNIWDRLQSKHLINKVFPKTIYREYNKQAVKYLKMTCQNNTKCKHYMSIYLSCISPSNLLETVKEKALPV